MNINNHGLELIKSFESLKLKSYLCPAKILTIGYGHTGKDVKPNQTITAEEAEQLLITDLNQFYRQVGPLIKVKLNSNQFSAIISFTFNVGVGNLKASTLLKKVNTNPNDPTIKDEFMKWINAGGKPLNGLVRRRTAEAELYFT